MHLTSFIFQVRAPVIAMTEEEACCLEENGGLFAQYKGRPCGRPLIQLS
jgi:hypothetical protein